MLTAGDVDKIVNGNFAPDIKKLASEIEVNVGDIAALQAIGVRIVAEYGQEGLRKVMQYIDTIHAEEFSDLEAFDVVVPKRRRKYWDDLGIRPMKTKGQMAADRFHEIYRDSCNKRKKTTKAEAVAQHIDALVKLLQEEPDAVVEPILDYLLERINWKRFEHVAQKLDEAGHG
jgi:hypothetical protein